MSIKQEYHNKNWSCRVYSGPLVRDKISLQIVLAPSCLQTYLEAYESWNNKW
jgi:hypothetical protein